MMFILQSRHLIDEDTIVIIHWLLNLVTGNVNISYKYQETSSIPSRRNISRMNTIDDYLPMSAVNH